VYQFTLEFIQNNEYLYELTPRFIVGYSAKFLVAFPKGVALPSHDIHGFAHKQG